MEELDSGVPLEELRTAMPLEEDKPTTTLLEEAVSGPELLDSSISPEEPWTTHVEEDESNSSSGDVSSWEEQAFNKRQAPKALAPKSFIFILIKYIVI